MKTIVLKAILFISLLITFCIVSMGQPPLPPDQENPDDWQPTAPIGSGIIVLLSLGAVYGGKKVYDARRKLRE
jgi:hypothetical protein